MLVAMRNALNIIWHLPPFLGFINATIVYVIGLLLTLTVVAAPIGLGLREYGKFLFWPFSRDMVRINEANYNQNKLWLKYSKFLMVLYVPFVGIWLFIWSVIDMVFSALTIIGIPSAIVMYKSSRVVLNPIHAKCVSYEVAREVERKLEMLKSKRIEDEANEIVGISEKPEKKGQRKE